MMRLKAYLKCSTKQQISFSWVSIQQQINFFLMLEKVKEKLAFSHGEGHIYGSVKSMKDKYDKYWLKIV